MTSLIALPSFPGLATGLYLYEQAMKMGMNYPIYFAGSIITIIPILIMFICFQDAFLSNMSIGGLKG
jgi:ABC-type maltose transport system permease subunit